MPQAGRSPVRGPMRRINSFNLPNPSGRTMALGLIQMNARTRKIMFLGSRERPVRRDDSLTAICEPIIWT
jgi:hypothetical protein